MAVEIVFSNETSSDMDPEAALLMSDLRGFSKSLQTDVIRARTPFQSRSEFSGFFINITTTDYFFSRCIDLHGLIIHHKTSHMH